MSYGIFDYYCNKINKNVKLTCEYINNKYCHKMIYIKKENDDCEKCGACIYKNDDIFNEISKNITQV